jgi:hypothetical protein
VQFKEGGKKLIFLKKNLVIPETQSQEDKDGSKKTIKESSRTGTHRRFTKASGDVGTLSKNHACGF